ncbi:matrixin family metalloprotease [Nocardioides pantholopis]|uniref:matrixin family metalloprotease n=1 Tax=Nocardioides pantholopis TaxID=2483798 RepID=UPI000FD89C2C|nr:matrixin family metalloprotease [Nocardioides pantholopis]
MSRSRRERGPVVPGVLVVAVIMAGVLLLDPTSSGQRLRQLIGLDDRVVDAVTVPDGGGSYSFAVTQPGSEDPVGWNPCTSITYVVNPEGAPDDWPALLEDSVSVIEDATGLDFEDGGTTEDRQFERRTTALGRGGPVLIGWADDEEMGSLSGDVAGVGGSAYVEQGGRRRFVTGSVALDVEVYDDLAERRDGREQMRAILIHELGHVVGLGHVADPGELMYGQNLARTDLGPGDLEGLARLGSVDCG